MQEAGKFLINLINYFVKRILPAGLVIFGIVWFSFLFFRGYSVVEFSNRLTLIGFLFMAIGAVVVFAQMITGRNMQVFGKEDLETVRKKAVFDQKSNVVREKRYNVGAQLWLIGIFCILISALYDSIF